MDTPTFFNRDNRRNRWLLFGAGFMLLILLGIMDQLTGHQSSFALLYLIPVALAAWFMGEISGVITAAASTITWMLADAAGGEAQREFLLNVAVRFSFFLIVALLLTRLNRTLRVEKRLARTDHVTGAVNARFFTELTQMEIRRFARYRRVFTVAYIDLDNFKAINDRFGHLTGDLVLRSVTHILGSCLRDTDVVARLGGDEFAVLLPETDESAARAVLSQINNHLLAEMHKHRWPVTFSIGVVSFHTVPPTVNELIQTADELMYSIKTDGKNKIRYAVYAS
jgi:diguanylate cyclase (GGDEF)-like protein